MAALRRPQVKRRAGDNPFEDRPEPLVTKHTRTEAEEDRLEAAAKFAAGRALEQREQFTSALRLYQRAFRLDPQATTILRSIVPLAYSLNRRIEALRYAVKLAEQDDSDPMLMRRIGQFLAETGEVKRGAKLLERALAIEEAEPSQPWPKRRFASSWDGCTFCWSGMPTPPVCLTRYCRHLKAPRILA